MQALCFNMCVYGRNRLPMISDDLSHWSDIFTWRQHHYQFIVNHYDSQTPQDQVNVPSPRCMFIINDDPSYSEKE